MVGTQLKQLENSAMQLVEQVLSSWCVQILLHQLGSPPARTSNTSSTSLRCSSRAENRDSQTKSAPSRRPLRSWTPCQTWSMCFACRTGRAFLCRSWRCPTHPAGGLQQHRQRPQVHLHQKVSSVDVDTPQAWPGGWSSWSASTCSACTSSATRRPSMATGRHSACWGVMHEAHLPPNVITYNAAISACM